MSYMYELYVYDYHDYVLHEEDKEYPKIMRYVVTMGTSHSQCGQYIK